MSFSGPRSIKSRKQEKEPSQYWIAFKLFCNRFYDVLTIMISIADITTDIMVLISFWMNDRMIFFIISLCILIIAQCSYTMAFSLKYNILDEPIPAVIAFCCLLPCANLISCFIYFGETSDLLDGIMNVFGLRPNTLFSVQPSDNELQVWVKKKFAKHMGFILEAAVEAFPQSLLQLAAIVIYHEINYISIASILLSLFSVCLKSLVFSQGLEYKTFIWTWLCLVTDFFGIFFVISWIFVTDVQIENNIDDIPFLNIFGEIWFWKSMFSSLPIAIGGLIFWFTWYFPKWFYDVVTDHDFDLELISAIIIMCTCFHLSVLIVSGAVFLMCDIFCFSIIALFLWKFTTKKWQIKRYQSILRQIMNFISDARIDDDECVNDRIIRILSINYSFACILSSSYSSCCEMRNWIASKKAEGYHSLQSITYGDIRNNCGNRDVANILPWVWKLFKTRIDGLQSYHGFCETNVIDMACIIFIIFGVFFGIPVLVICKLVQFLFAYIVIGIVCFANDDMLWGKIDEFQIWMIAIYLVLQFILFVIFCSFVRMHFWLWHVMPGHLILLNISEKECDDVLLRNAFKFYDDIQWYPIVDKIICKQFGKDIASVILYYLKNIDCSETEEIMLCKE